MQVSFSSRFILQILYMLMSKLKNYLRDYPTWKKNVGLNILKKGLATPFINVSFAGLLWGYNDELPCDKLPR